MYRVLIVDDEPIIRNGLSKLIPWEELGITIIAMAESGEQAERLLQDNVIDILITDIRMNGMNGLALIANAKKRYPRLHCIVLSGYNDFEYTKEAIQLGIENYIMKPVDEEELMETLLNIIKKLEAETSGEYLFKQDKQALFQMVLWRWLNGTIDDIALRYRASMLMIPLEGEQIQACVIKSLAESSWEQKQNVATYFDRTWMELPGIWSGVCWETDKDIVIVFIGEIEKHAVRLRKQLHEFIKMLEWSNKGVFFAGLGSCEERIMFLSRSYKNARMAADLCAVKREMKIMDEIDLDKSQSMNIPGIRFDSLEEFLREGNEEEIQHFWEVWYRELLENRVDVDAVKEYALEIMCWLVAIRTQNFMISKTENTMDVLREISRAQHLDALIHVLINESKACGRQFGQIYAGGNPVVGRVLDTIKVRYREEITLNELAGQFCIHPVYLGKLFKEQTGQTFSAYLNHYRIRKAKKLLMEVDWTVAKVAKEVGYGDSGYFCKIFKKQTGYFPREYRLKNREV